MYVTFALLLLSILLTSLYLKSIYSYWNKRSIPCVKNVIVGIGNMWPVLSLKKNFFEYIDDIYTIHGNRSMIGFYDMMTPALIVCDPQLVKIVLQTNFASFHRNKFEVDPNLDPIFHNSTIFADGYKWVESRRRLMLAVSSARLRMLFQVIEEVGKDMTRFLERRLDNAEGKIEIELRELFSRFTAELVARAIFNIEGSCFEEYPSPFQEMGTQIFEPNFGTVLSQILVFFMPWLNKICKISFLPKGVDQFFRMILRQAIEAREGETEPRSDFFQHIADLVKNEGENLSEDALVAHAFSFYTEAYGTTSVALSYVGYQLGCHQNVQNKIREEIGSVTDKNNGVITYEALKRMTYLNWVINESQRINSTEGVISKICTRPCELIGLDGLMCRVDPGTEIIVPMKSLHKDPKYWDNPDVFDPDRFNPDRRTNIKKHTFLPFGEGPRMCVGSKLALMEIKACLTILLDKYRLTSSPRTRVPLKKSPGVFLPVAVDGIWAFIERI